MRANQDIPDANLVGGWRWRHGGQHLHPPGPDLRGIGAL